MQSPEDHKDLILAIGRESYAVVAHLDHPLLILEFCADADLGRLRGSELDRIGEQILKQQCQQAKISVNLGQILETHLGWAAHALGLQFATPVFDGAREDEIKEQLRKAGLPE